MARPNQRNAPLPGNAPYNKPNTDDITEEPRWWEAQNIPWQIVRELRRRRNDTNIGQDTSAYQAEQLVTNFYQNHPNYKGPITPWVRAFSNGTGRVASPLVPTSQYLLKNGSMPKYEGFLLEGGKGFDKAYGFKRFGNVLTKDKSILGFQANGEPHYIDPVYIDDFSYNTNTGKLYPQNTQAPRILPPPGITSISIKTNKEMMAFATINWKCYSLAQLEYMTPFWLSPKINVFLEFGYNLFNISSLLNYDNKAECYQLLTNPQKALKRWYDSYGNYGLVTGIITKYEWSTNDGFVYNCTTELTSRQALYAGFRTDNPVITTSTNSNEATTKEYLTLKDFLKNYVTPTVAKGCLITESNFIEYVDEYIKNPNEANKLKHKSKQNSDEDEFESIGRSKKEFFGGKKETRIFCGRDPDIYKGQLNPIEREEVINQQNITYSYSSAASYTPPQKKVTKLAAIRYRSNLSGNQKYGTISDADGSTDFDAKIGGYDGVWYQLDFVFEIINLFCEEKYTRNNKIDISDILIGAHPNLISCNPNVLIPNQVSPKLNLGRKSRDGFLSQDNDFEAEKNPYIAQWSYWNWKQMMTDGQKYEKNLIDKFNKENIAAENFPSKNKLKSPWKAAQKQYTSFKTNGCPRDDLDGIINKIYYDRTKQYGYEFNLASFPQMQETKIGQRKYPAFYTGFLKHIYVSNSVLENLSSIEDSSNTNTLRNLVKSLLNTLNESVDNFWNLDVVQSDDGGLSIIDKNLNLAYNKIYAFDFATTNNVVKSFDFKVNLTNEQTSQVLYGSGQNANNILNELSNIESDSNRSLSQKKSAITQLQTGLPKLNYQDRFEELDTLKQFEIALGRINVLESEETNKTNKTKDGDGSIVPRGPFVDKNNDIRKLQIKESQNKQILTMRLRRLYSSEQNSEFEELGEGASAIQYNWVNLNLPPSMKGKLRELLDDGDTLNNKSKYAGPADNFILNLKLDGIFGFRMFQHFAVMNLPKPYVPGNVIFMITDIDHQISEGKWETNLSALLRCTSDQQYEYIYI